MRDPITWSFPLGRMFGINIRVHVMLPLVMLGLVLRVTTEFNVPLLAAVVLQGLMFLSILLHEFGHCFAARSVDGDANDVVLWPLGGLAYCDLPHTPRAHLITALGGPAVNFLLCVVTGGALAFAGLMPPMHPLYAPYEPQLWHWRENTYYSTPHDRGVAEAPPPGKVVPIPPNDNKTGLSESRPPAVQAAQDKFLSAWQVLAARLFWVNWFLFIFNMALPGYPLDMGRVLQAILWMRSDYRQATATACYAGFVTAIVVGVYSIVRNEVLAFALCLFIYLSCKQQLILLETGGEDAPFGYDFSQGYTSLEGAQPAAPPKRRKPNFFQRWLQRRAARKAQRELEQREAEDRRMDELLEKVQKEGIQALTEEERRFLTRVSARYRGGKP